MILLTESGVWILETARRVKVTPPAVTNWRKRFREQRLAGLHDQLKSGRPRTHSEEDIALLLNAALTRRPAGATHRSARELADETSISKSTVQRYLALFGVQPHRPKSFKLSTDPFFIEKLRDVVGLYLNPRIKPWFCVSMRRARFRLCSVRNLCYRWVSDTSRA
jgi:transposase